MPPRIVCRRRPRIPPPLRRPSAAHLRRLRQNVGQLSRSRPPGESTSPVATTLDNIGARSRGIDQGSPDAEAEHNEHGRQFVGNLVAAVTTGTTPLAPAGYNDDDDDDEDMEAGYRPDAYHDDDYDGAAAEPTALGLACDTSIHLPVTGSAQPMMGTHAPTPTPTPDRRLRTATDGDHMNSSHLIAPSPPTGRSAEQQPPPQTWLSATSASGPPTWPTARRVEALERRIQTPGQWPRFNGAPASPQSINPVDGTERRLDITQALSIVDFLNEFDTRMRSAIDYLSPTEVFNLLWMSLLEGHPNTLADQLRQRLRAEALRAGVNMGTSINPRTLQVTARALSAFRRQLAQRYTLLEYRRQLRAQVLLLRQRADEPIEHFAARFKALISLRDTFRQRRHTTTYGGARRGAPGCLSRHPYKSLPPLRSS